MSPDDTELLEAEERSGVYGGAREWEGDGCREVVEVGFGDEDRDDEGDSFVGLRKSTLGGGCETEGVFEGWCVEDVTIVGGHPNLFLHLEMQASTCFIPCEQDGAPKARCEETSASTTKSKGEKRNMTTRTSVEVKRALKEKEGDKDNQEKAED